MAAREKFYLELLTFHSKFLAPPIFKIGAFSLNIPLRTSKGAMSHPLRRFRTCSTPKVIDLPSFLNLIRPIKGIT